MWSRLRDRIGPFMRTVGPFFVIATALGLGAAELDFPEEWMWDDASDGLVIATVVAVAASGIYGAFKYFDDRESAKEAQAAERDEELEDRAQEIDRLCRKAFIPINECLPKVPISRIGLHVWRVAPDNSRLIRLHKYTMDQERTEMSLTWTCGRGAIGLAWKERARKIAPRLSRLVSIARSMDDETFNERPANERCGLERIDLVDGSRYEAIMAVPLLSDQPGPDGGDPPVLGVVSVDSTDDVSEVQFRTLHSHEDFDSFLGSCQNYLRWLATRETTR